MTERVRTWSQSVALAAAGLVLLASVSGCAARRPRMFLPAGPEQQAAVLAAWREAIARADSLPAARLLYEARLSQGLARQSGTLAVRLTAESVTATLAGPFGTTLARYADGALTGEGIRPISVEPAALRAILSGAWREPGTLVTGIAQDSGRLQWEGATRVEGVVDVPRAVFESLRIERPEGGIAATYGGARDPFPEKIDLEDLRTGSHMKLTRVALEKLRIED